MDTPDDLAHAIPSGGEQRRYQRDPVSLLLALRAAFFGLCASTRLCREVQTYLHVGETADPMAKCSSAAVLADFGTRPCEFLPSGRITGGYP